MTDHHIRTTDLTQRRTRRTELLPWIPTGLGALGLPRARRNARSVARCPLTAALAELMLAVSAVVGRFDVEPVSEAVEVDLTLRPKGVLPDVVHQRDARGLVGLVG